jgi:hypothetical protein
MKNLILPLCAALVLAAGSVHAADDALPGTWNADLKPGGDLKSLTTTVVAAPGGYSFNSDMQPAQGPAMKTSLAVVLDGKPHTTRSAFGPIISTCHREDPHTIACKVNLGGSDSQSVFTLSADGKTLTEADTHEVVNVRASSSSNISEQNGKVTQGPASSHTQTTTSEETETTVFHKQ